MIAYMRNFYDICGAYRLQEPDMGKREGIDLHLKGSSVRNGSSLLFGTESKFMIAVYRHITQRIDS